MITGTIHDIPTVVPAIDPAQLAALNEIWVNNTLFLGKICLVIGFLIGIFAGYNLHRWLKDGRI